MATYLFITGAWHRASCWDRVVPLLEAKGHRVLAPDLPGVGADRTPLAVDTMGQWTEAMVALVREQPEPAILVGHSRGGLILGAVAEAVPERVALAVFLAAVLLADGQAAIDSGMLSDELVAAFQPAEDGRAVRIDAARAPEIFYGQVAPDERAAAVAGLVDEPLQPSTVPAGLGTDRFGRVPRAYIETTEDRAIPIAKQREMQARWPCDPVVTLTSDHSPFYSMPDRLADVLDGLARHVAR